MNIPPPTNITIHGKYFWKNNLILNWPSASTLSTRSSTLLILLVKKGNKFIIDDQVAGYSFSLSTVGQMDGLILTIIVAITRDIDRAQRSGPHSHK
mgnify:CR=1 FL=1